MTSSIPAIKLRNGTHIPQLGFGTWRLPGKDVEEPLRIALDLGYTHIDTAQLYENEKNIGKVIRNIAREKLFITSKVWHTQLQEKDVLHSCEQTLRDLGIAYLDLYLIHWPNKDIPIDETLRAFKTLHESGKVRSIGVSNFTAAHLKDALSVSPIPLCMNQVEFHPWLYQKKLLEFCHTHKIAMTSYAPLGRAQFLDNPIVQNIAKAHGKSAAQVLLRWGVQHGNIVIPKGKSREHIEENMHIFDFALTAADMALLDAMPQQRLVHPGFAEFD